LAKQKLWIFLILALLLSLGYHLASQELWVRYLGNSEFFFPTNRRITYGYSDAFLVPALLIGVLAWGMGFYRSRDQKWVPFTATIILILVVIVTAGAPWPCWPTPCP